LELQSKQIKEVGACPYGAEDQSPKEEQVQEMLPEKAIRFSTFSTLFRLISTLKKRRLELDLKVPGHEQTTLATPQSFCILLFLNLHLVTLHQIEFSL